MTLSPLPGGLGAPHAIHVLVAVRFINALVVLHVLVPDVLDAAGRARVDRIGARARKREPQGVEPLEKLRLALLLLLGVELAGPDAYSAFPVWEGEPVP